MRMKERYRRAHPAPLLLAILWWGLAGIPVEAEIVDFPDENLAAAVADAIGKPLDEDIEDTDLVGVGFTNLSAPAKEITDLTGLEFATDLTSLDLSGNHIVNIARVAALTGLTILDLSNNQTDPPNGDRLEDISALQNLTGLTTLRLAGNGIVDIAPLSGLINLADLDLSNNKDNATGLAGITDFDVLGNLTALTSLDLADSGVDEIAVLANLTGLSTLDLSGNEIRDLTALSGLDSLAYLDLEDNQVEDIAPLADNEGFGPGAQIFLKGNRLTLDSQCLSIDALVSRGVEVSYDPLESLNIVRLVPRHSAPYLVEFDFSLRDQNGDPVVGSSSLLRGLPSEDSVPAGEDDAAVFLAKTSQKQQKCFLVLDYSTNVTSVFDYGDEDGDGKSNALEVAEAGAISVIGVLNGGAQAGIYEFHREDREPGLVSGFSTRHEELKDEILRIWYRHIQQAQAQIQLWDTVYQALKQFDDGSGVDEERFVLLLSNGSDTSSEHTSSEVTDLANDKAVTLYCIGFGNGLSVAGREQVLMDMASDTNGVYYDGGNNPGDLAEGFRDAVRDLGGRFTLRWSALSRAAEGFTPEFSIETIDVPGPGEPDCSCPPASSDMATGETYLPADYEGDVLQGVLRMVVDPDVGINNKAVDFRAAYLPPLIRRIEVRFVPDRTFSLATQIGTGEGGVAPDTWQTRHNQTFGVGVAWVELSSPDPSDESTALPASAFGRLAKLSFSTNTSLQITDAEVVDDETYEGQSFVISIDTDSEGPLEGSGEGSLEGSGEGEGQGEGEGEGNGTEGEGEGEGPLGGGEPPVSGCASRRDASRGPGFAQAGADSLMMGFLIGVLLLAGRARKFRHRTRA